MGTLELREVWSKNGPDPINHQNMLLTKALKGCYKFGAPTKIQQNMLLTKDLKGVVRFDHPPVDDQNELLKKNLLARCSTSGLPNRLKYALGEDFY
jgi:hypothetical protein